MKKLLFIYIVAILFSTNVYGQITIPVTFVNNTPADADQVNSNFTALGSSALNRTGGTISGNIAVGAAVTIDGVDIGVQACILCTPTFAALNITGTITAGSLGSTPLDASNLSTGTLPSARLAGTYSSAVQFSDAGNLFTGNGALITALNASALATGTVPNARLSANVGLFNAAVAFSYNATPLALRWTRSDAAALDVLWMSGVAGASDVFLDGPGAIGTLTLRTNSTAALSINSAQLATFSNLVQLGTRTFANLGTPANGSIIYCSNCDPASVPCTTGGASSGAMAFRVAGAWKCN